MTRQIEEQEVSLATIAEGALNERFELARDEVLQNVRDPNTKPTAKREILIKLVWTPRDDRQFSDIAIEVKTKLAPVLPLHAFALVTLRHDGVVVATEAQVRPGADPRQAELPVNVTPIRKEETK